MTAEFVELVVADCPEPASMIITLTSAKSASLIWINARMRRRRYLVFVMMGSRIWKTPEVEAFIERNG